MPNTIQPKVSESDVQGQHPYAGKLMEDGIHKVGGTLVEVTSEKQAMEVVSNSDISEVTLYVGKLKACPPDKQEYGVFEAPLFYQGDDGKFYKHKHEKIILQRIAKQNADGTSTFTNKFKPASFPSPSFPVIAHQEVLDLLFQAGFDKAKVHYGRGKNLMMVELHSEFSRESIVPGDIVEFGAMVRNGYDGMTALGMDLFSYRLNCANGAIAKFGEARLSMLKQEYSSLHTSVSIRHSGDRQKIIAEFKKGLEQMVDASKVLIDLYKRMTQRRLDHALAERLALRVPKKYQPDYFQYEEKVKDGKKVEEFKLADTSLKVWEGFNSLTEKIWHSGDLQIQSKTNMIKNIHNEILVATVQPLKI